MKTLLNREQTTVSRHVLNVYSKGSIVGTIWQEGRVRIKGTWFGQTADGKHLGTHVGTKEEAVAALFR